MGQASNDKTQESPERYTFWDAASEARTLKRGVRVASVVGTILNLINQGDAIFGDNDFIVWKFCITYMVPFSVTVYSMATGLVEFRNSQLKDNAS